MRRYLTGGFLLNIAIKTSFIEKSIKHTCLLVQSNDIIKYSVSILFFLLNWLDVS